MLHEILFSLLQKQSPEIITKTTDESQTSRRQLQTTTDELQTSHRRIHTNRSESFFEFIYKTLFSERIWFSKCSYEKVVFT